MTTKTLIIFSINIRLHFRGVQHFFFPCQILANYMYKLTGEEKYPQSSSIVQSYTNS